MKLIKEKKIIMYAAVFVIVSLAYIMWRLISPSETLGFRVAMGVLVGLAGITDLVLLKKKQLTADRLAASIIFAGFVMRIGYML